MAPTHLHVYRCSFCDVVATSTVRMGLKCVRCLRLMRYKWSQPITTQAERDIASAGVLFDPFLPRPPKRCDTCRQPITGTPMKIAGVGVFCGDDCAQVMVVKVQAYRQRLAEEAAELERKVCPWKTS